METGFIMSSDMIDWDGGRMENTDKKKQLVEIAKDLALKMMRDSGVLIPFLLVDLKDGRRINVIISGDLEKGAQDV